MLTLQLRELEADGFVLRTVYPVVPPHVEYTLTPFGSETPADNTTAVRSAITPRSRDTIRADGWMEIVMIRFLACALVSLCFSLCAQAALDIGEVAPDFTAQAALVRP